MKNITLRPTMLLSTLLAALLLLSGCGAKASDQMYYESAKEDFSYTGYDSYNDLDSLDLYDSPAEYSTAMLSDAASASYDPSDGAQPSAPASDSSSDKNGLDRKIIRNADIDIKADNANECYRSILDFAISLGGYESSSRMSKDEYSSGRYIRIYATLKLPPDKLDEFVERAGDYGDVTSSSVTSEEITESYYDLKTRLASKQKALDSYYKLLEKAESIDEILSIQSRIDSLTEDIESVKGKLRVYDALVDESTVDLTITENYNMPIEEKEFTWDSLTFSSFLRLVKNGFLGVCNFLWSLLQWLVIILISASPIIIIAAAIILIVRRLKKKGVIKPRKKKTKSPRSTPVYTGAAAQEDGSETDGASADKTE